MNVQIKVEPTPQVTSTPPANGSTPSSNDLQALWDLGQLQFLANTLASLTPGSTLYTETLAQFQTLYGQYSFSTNANGGFSATFGGIQITDPDVLEILQNLYTSTFSKFSSNPPSGTDVGNYKAAFYSTNQIKWSSDGQTENLLARILMVTYDAQYSMEDNLQNTTTNTSLLMFYLSIVNAPGNVAGTLDTILSEGYYDGAMFNMGNIRAIAQVLCDQLANDPTLYQVVLAGLNMGTKDSLYNTLGQYFATLTPDGNEGADWGWEARFFPISGLESKKTNNAIPIDDQNSYLENRIELAKKAMSNRDDTHARPFKLTPK